jgi:glucose PTS system EIICB or EIICBA component
MGQGFAIEPINNDIYSPIKGKIISIFNTKHAIGLEASDGLEVLIHMGADTVELNGKPFKINVNIGEYVSESTKLAEMDLNEVKHAGKSATVITVITNSDDKISNMEFKFFSGTTLKSHEEVGKVYLK